MLLVVPETVRVSLSPGLYESLSIVRESQVAVGGVGVVTENTDSQASAAGFATQVYEDVEQI